MRSKYRFNFYRSVLDLNKTNVGIYDGFLRGLLVVRPFILSTNHLIFYFFLILRVKFLIFGLLLQVLKASESPDKLRRKRALLLKWQARSSPTTAVLWTPSPDMWTASKAWSWRRKQSKKTAKAKERMQHEGKLFKSYFFIYNLISVSAGIFTRTQPTSWARTPASSKTSSTTFSTTRYTTKLQIYNFSWPWLRFLTR